MTEQSYHVASDEEMEALGFDCVWERDGLVLVGPNGFYCSLGEPEDRDWCRDASEVVSELNRLYSIIELLKEDIMAQHRTTLIWKFI